MDIFFLCFSLVEKAKANQELQHDIRHHGLAMKSYA